MLPRALRSSFGVFRSSFGLEVAPSDGAVRFSQIFDSNVWVSLGASHRQRSKAALQKLLQKLLHWAGKHRHSDILHTTL